MPKPTLNAGFCFNPISLSALMLACLILLLAGCSSATSRPDSSSKSESEPTLDEIYNHATHWSRNSAEHRAIYEQTYKFAGERIRVLSDGLEAGSWAVSLDADETLIDNSLYQVEIASRGESYGPVSWNEWIQRKSAPPMPGAVEFTRLVKSLGGVVAVVTNRRHYQCALTAENMLEVGITFDVALCRVDGGEKELRFDALANGTADQWLDAQFNGDAARRPLDVLMWVGDNIGDFPGQDQSIRNSEGPLSDFGDRFFVLPNPMYGSWEVNPKE